MTGGIKVKRDAGRTVFIRKMHPIGSKEQENYRRVFGLISARKLRKNFDIKMYLTKVLGAC
jgi:hypothetical protein